MVKVIVDLRGLTFSEKVKVNTEAWCEALHVNGKQGSVLAESGEIVGWEYFIPDHTEYHFRNMMGKAKVALYSSSGTTYCKKRGEGIHCTLHTSPCHMLGVESDCSMVK